jgi:cytochrome P450
MRRSAQSAIDDVESSSLVDEKPNSDKTENSVVPGTKRHNIFHTILQSSLPPQEKTQKRLGQEGVVAIAAGGETCGRMMSNALYYVLANKERVMPLLQQELLSVMPTPDTQPELKSLEQLPYLVRTTIPPHPCFLHNLFPSPSNTPSPQQTAIIRETLRLSALLTSRLPLVAPTQTLQYKSYVIPPGNAISMSLRHILHDPDIFESPMEFKPERWLKTNPDLERINRFYVPFSRGTRGCIGIKYVSVHDGGGSNV